MNDEQSEKLLSFQSITQLENINLCIELLEFSKWNLEVAVDRFCTGVYSGSDQQTWCHSEDANDHAPNQPLQDRVLNFDIRYHGKSYHIQIPHICTVGDLKEKLREQIGLPVNCMSLHGWKDKDDTMIRDTDLLHAMHLPKDNQLKLRRMVGEAMEMELEPEPDRAIELNDKEFELCIKYDDEDFKLKYKGSKTIRQVKEDVVEITCPVRLQKWQGWPQKVAESVTLAASGIDFPMHELTVSKRFDEYAQPVTSNTPSTKKRSTRPKRPGLLKSPNKEDMEDALIDDSEKYLIPDNVKDEVTAIEHFRQVFRKRFGEKHPAFRVTSFDDLMRDCFKCKVEQRKLVAMYLHHDCNISINFFCKDVLCNETILNVLDNFVVWPWDLTRQSNRIMFVEHVHKYFTKADAHCIENGHHDQLPVLIIAWHSRGKIEIVDSIPGAVKLVDLADRLWTRVLKFEEMQPINIEDEKVRESNRIREEELKADVEESEKADREKERIRKEAQLKKEEDERRQQEELRKREEEDKEIQECRTRVNEEPDNTCSLDDVVTLKIVCSRDKDLHRRFMKSDTVEELLNYIMSEGYHPKRYRVLTQFPKQNLMEVDRCKRLCDILNGQCEKLVVEEIFEVAQ